MAGFIREELLAVGARQALAPVLDIARDPRWGRLEETYGEDPYLAGRLGVAFVRGLQGSDLGRGVIATAKHFLGYGLPEGGMNHAPVQIGPRELREVFAEPFSSKWIFDVELIARYIQLLNQSDRQMNFIYEQPLDQWKEIDGSRLQSQDFLTAVLDLANIYWRHLRPGARPYISANRDELISDSPAAKSNQANESRAA